MSVTRVLVNCWSKSKVPLVGLGSSFLSWIHLSNLFLRSAIKWRGIAGEKKSLINVVSVAPLFLCVCWIGGTQSARFECGTLWMFCPIDSFSLLNISWNIQLFFFYARTFCPSINMGIHFCTKEREKKKMSILPIHPYRIMRLSLNCCCKWPCVYPAELCTRDVGRVETQKSPPFPHLPSWDFPSQVHIYIYDSLCTVYVVSKSVFSLYTIGSHKKDIKLYTKRRKKKIEFRRGGE